MRIEALAETVTEPSGVGDLWHMTWGPGDEHFIGQCDGYGWKEDPYYAGHSYTSRMYQVIGDPPNPSFTFMPGYPDIINDYENTEFAGRYYGAGILAIDGRIYHFLSSFRDRFGHPNNGFTMVKIIYSDDKGKTWHNHDGSTPVTLEPWDDRTAGNMLFCNEPNGAFGIVSILQMGSEYSQNKDGYIYLYSPNGYVDGLMNQLVLCRVKTGHILDRSAYEYFQAMDLDGQAQWSNSIDERGVVYEFPKGWVNWASMHGWGWLPSVVYNQPLGLYMMTSWGTGFHPDRGVWFEEPNYFGFWVAPNPWGPWTQIHEDKAWAPDGNPDSRPYAPQIPAKWISEDGKSFWIVWTDFRAISDGTDIESIDDMYDKFKIQQPGYAFQCQKYLIHTDDVYDADLML